MCRIKIILYSLGFLSFAILMISLDPVQSQEMDHGLMEMNMGEIEDIRVSKNRDMGEMKISDAMAIMKGKMIFQMSCFLCHGRKGEGEGYGPAAMFLGPYSHPRPNNFTSGIFKFRSTESGDLPMLTDLMRTIREGIPGYRPSFRNLGKNGIQSVAMYIAKEFIQEELPSTTTIKYVKHLGPYTYSAKSAWRGGLLFKIMKCNECHGDEGKSGRIDLKDEQKLMIHPIDLTRQGTFGNGTSHEDIYRTIMTGLDGTPMPGYNDSFAGEEASAWDLVHYILSLQGR